MSDVLSYHQQRCIIAYFDELLVNGYSRRMEKNCLFVNDNNNNYKHIPSDIVRLCIKYYHISNDIFDPELHSIMLDITDNTVFCELGYTENNNEDDCFQCISVKHN